MLRKRGAAHFEMIMAFVFFMGFVVFMFMVLKPYDSTILSGAVISELYDTFEEEVHTNLTNVFLKADATAVTEPCFYVELPNEVFAYALTQSIVTNVTDVRFSSELSNSNLNIEDTEVIFYKVAISPDFESDEVMFCAEVPNYDLGSLLERRVVSYGALQEMSARYYSDYDGLRTDLGVPGTLDFSIVSEDISGIDMQSIVPDSGEIIARGYIAEVLYNNGTVVNGKFIFRVW